MEQQKKENENENIKKEIEIKKDEDEDKDKDNENNKKTNTKLKNIELYTTTFGQISLTLTPRYKVTEVIGQGAYGVVFSGIDLEDNSKVAIKKISDVFSKDPEYQKRILREIKVMEHFIGHENIVCLKDLIPPKNFDEFKDIYIVMELMDGNLNNIIRSNQIINDRNVQYFLYQMLKGLKFIHSANVLHRDIKPSNILLSSSMDVQICDFGLARGVDFETDPSMSTAYVATRWYRAPELLLMWEKATPAMDTWSLGCILAELLDHRKKRRPLFPGRDYLHQIDLILNISGTPEQDDIKACAKAKKYLSTLPLKLKKDLTKYYSKASKQAIDLLSKMLTFNPQKRITVNEALEHDFFKDIREDEDEIDCDEIFSFRFQKDVADKKITIKKSIYDTIMEWNKIENEITGDAIMVDPPKNKNKNKNKEGEDDDDEEEEEEEEEDEDEEN